MKRCKSCRAPIVWATTERGRAIPVDAEPHADGNLVLVPVDRGVYLARAYQPLFDGKAKRHRSHFATCPNAPEHRKS